MFLSHEELITQLCQHILFLQTTAQEVMCKIHVSVGSATRADGAGSRGPVADAAGGLQLCASTGTHRQMTFCGICTAQHSVTAKHLQFSTRSSFFKSCKSRTALSEPESSRRGRSAPPRVCLQMESLQPAPYRQSGVVALGFSLRAATPPRKRLRNTVGISWVNHTKRSHSPQL